MDTDADTAASLAYALREEASRWPDHELRSRMAALRARKSAQQFSTADLAECLALGAEAARRSAGTEADVSVLAAAGEVASGRVAEVREADDRRLACLLAAVVYALDGPGVHIVCVDDAEAARQAERAAAILGSAGISFGLIGPPKPWSREPRRTAYQADAPSPAWHR